MPEKSLADKLKLWRDLADGMQARPEELAFLEEDRRRLAALFLEVQRLVTQQDLYEARLREATRQRVEAEAEADELTGRLIGALKARFGKRDPGLHQFGIRPNEKPGPRRTRREEPAAADADEKAP